jgi:hypothetical protein
MHSDIDVETPYTVRLQDAGKITEEGRITAERSFTRALEKAVGGEENVVPALRAFERIAESGRKPSKAQEAEAKSWQEAWNKAVQAGTKAFGADQAEAWFEIRVA